MNTGKFIVFEGIDGSGKSSQLEKALAYLKAKGFAVLATEEPSEGEIGRLIRQALEGHVHFSEATMAALFAADRLDHLQKNDGILEALQKGKMVLCDRFILSSLAYNSIKVSPLWVTRLNEQAKNLTKNHLTLLFDCHEDVALERINKRGSERELFETKERLRQVRERYLALAEAQEKTYIIDADKDPDSIFEEVKTYLDRFC